VSSSGTTRALSSNPVCQSSGKLSNPPGGSWYTPSTSNFAAFRKSPAWATATNGPAILAKSSRAILLHPPGHAQADFGEAIGIIGGVECKIHFFAFDLPHSDACFVVGYPAETTEAFCDGHVRAFAFFGGVPQSILYDNTKIAVARILGDGKRQRTRVFTELQSHYLFEDRFGRPGKGNDKGKVEGLVGYARRNFLVPIPVFESFEALNSYLLECCRRRMADCLRGRDGTIGERLERDLAAFQTPLPAPYDACEKVATTVSCSCLESAVQHSKISQAIC
jgi:hypothetical protein